MKKPPGNRWNDNPLNTNPLITMETMNTNTHTNGEQVIAVIPVDVLRILKGFTSNDPLRPALQCVFIERLESGGCRATATDGHALLSVHMPDADCFDSALVNLAGQRVPAKKSLERAVIRAKRTELYGNSLTPEAILATEPEFGLKYVNWRGVLPRQERAENIGTITFNMQVLAKFASIKNSAGDSLFKMSFTGATHAVSMVGTMESNTGEIFDVYGLAMPCTPGYVEYEDFAPAWATKEAYSPEPETAPEPAIA